MDEREWGERKQEEAGEREAGEKLEEGGKGRRGDEVMSAAATAAPLASTLILVLA